MRDCLLHLFTVALLGALLSLPASAHAQQSTPRLSCRFEPSSIPVGQPAILLVELADVQNLYGYELKMTYDSGRVQVQDGDAGKDGINLQLGSFLSPDFVLFNTAENGAVHIALTQLAPAAPKSGAGELARATVQGTAGGFANFAFGDVTLSDVNGRAIQVTAQDCLLEVGAAGQPTPTPTSTPLPTATPTGTAVAAATPTDTPAPPTATYTPLPPAPGVPPSATPTPPPTATPGPTATATPTPTPSAVVITTPTPVPMQPAEAVAQTQGDQQQSALPTATPTAQVPAVVTVTEESQPTASALSALPDPPSAIVVVELTQTPTATPTLTPLVIAQVPRRSLPPTEVIAQPQDPQPGVDRHLLYQSLGWGSLLATCVLAFVVWRLRKSQSK